MTATVKTNADKIRERIVALESFAWVKPAVAQSALIVKGKIAQYAPATEANNPANRRYYKRGTGPVYRRLDGTLSIRRTSETLGRRWTTKVAANGMSAIVENLASYAGWVQHEETQASWHRRRNWKTDHQIIIESLPAIGATYLRNLSAALRFVK